MSSRIMVDAGPGEREPPPAPTPDPQRTPPEPVERREAERADTAPERAPATPEPRDAPAEPLETAPEDPAEIAKKRIDRLTRERFEAIRQRDEMRAEHQRWQQEMQRAQQPPGANGVPPGQEDPYQRARREVREEALIGDFNRACNTLFEKGRQEFGDEMTDAVGALNAVDWGGRPDALAAVTQLPDGHRVYRELARDLDNAARVLSLPPMALAMELAQMSHQSSEGHSPEAARDAYASPPMDRGVPVTRAPGPVSRVGGNSRAPERPLDSPHVSMAEFIRRRDRDERRSRIAR